MAAERARLRLSRAVPEHPRSRDSLPRRLRAATRELHALVERRGVFARLIDGSIELPEYVLLLSNLHRIYAALEAAFERHRNHPAIEPVFERALLRQAAIESDLRALGATVPHRSAACLVPATHAYVRRLEWLGGPFVDTRCAVRVECLLAHLYVRYLGDLSGGQMLARSLATLLRASGGDATAFYRFGSGAEVAQLSAAFRGGLQVAGERCLHASMVVEEARRAFVLHVGVADGLERWRQSSRKDA